MTPLERLHELEAMILDAGARFGAQETLGRLAELLEELSRGDAAARDRQRCLHLLHLVSFKTERFAEALEFGERAFGVFPEIGHLSPNAALMFPYRMGECCLNLGRFAEAIPHYRRALAVLEAQSPEESDAKLGTLEKIGYCLHENGQFAEAYASNQGLLARGEKFFSPVDPVLGSVLTNLANNAYDLGDYPQAQAYLERGYAICAQVPEQAYEFMFQLGVLSAETGQTDRAMEWFQRQLAMAELLESPDHIEEAWRNIQMLKAGVA